MSRHDMTMDGSPVFIPRRSKALRGNEPVTRVNETPVNARKEALRSALNAVGFSADYRPPFNVQENALGLLEWLDFPNTPDGHRDLIWLCNQIARIGKRHPYTLECRDNFRACRGQQMSVAHCRAKASGCCGSFDKLLINPQTRNAFWVGFNYGH